MNCFTFSLYYLKQQNIQTPDKWNGRSVKAEMSNILLNPKHYIQSKTHIKYILSFTQKADIAQKNDIIVHDKGIGIALNNLMYVSLNHLKKIKVLKIKQNCKIRRVK